MRTILNELIQLHQVALINNDSEVLVSLKKLAELGVPNQLINSCLRFAHSSCQIENIRLTLLGELREYKFSFN